MNKQKYNRICMGANIDAYNRNEPYFIEEHKFQDTKRHPKHGICPDICPECLEKYKAYINFKMGGKNGK